MGEWDHQSQHLTYGCEPSTSDHASSQHALDLQRISPVASLMYKNKTIRSSTNQLECQLDTKQMQQENQINKYSLNTSVGSSASSSSSSYLDISRTHPLKTSKVRSFFTAPSEHKRKVKKKKCRVSFFRIGCNSSSSSVNSDLAYGTGFIRISKRKKRRRSLKEIPHHNTDISERHNQNSQVDICKEKGRSAPGCSSSESTTSSVAEKCRYNKKCHGKKKIKKPSRKVPKDINTTAEILAIGAGLTKLANDCNNVGSKTTRNRKNSRRGPNSRKSDVFGPTKASNNPSANEDWESVYESQSDSSTDSKLAYGSNNKSYWDIFGWSKSTKGSSPTDSFVESMAYGISHENENTIDSTQLRELVLDPMLDEPNDSHPSRSMSNSIHYSSNSIRKTKIKEDLTNNHIWPLIPTTETTSSIAGLKKNYMIESDPLIPTSFQSTPLQIVQPKPITPISQSIYEPEAHLNVNFNSAIPKEATHDIEQIHGDQHTAFPSARFRPEILTQRNRPELIVGRNFEVVDDKRPQMWECAHSGFDTHLEQDELYWPHRERYNPLLNMECEDRKDKSHMYEAKMKIDYPEIERNSGKRCMPKLKFHDSRQDWYACPGKDNKPELGSINPIDLTDSPRKSSIFYDNDRNDEMQGAGIPFSTKITNDISFLKSDDSLSFHSNDNPLRTYYSKQELDSLNPSRAYSDNQQTWRASSSFYSQVDELSHDTNPKGPWNSTLNDPERGCEQSRNPCTSHTIATIGGAVAVTTGRGYRKSCSRKRKNERRQIGCGYENDQGKGNHSSLAASFNIEPDTELERDQAYLTDSNSHQQFSSSIRPISPNSHPSFADSGPDVTDLFPHRDNVQELRFYDPSNVGFEFEYSLNHRDRPQTPRDYRINLNHSKLESFHDLFSENDPKSPSNNLIKPTQKISPPVNEKEKKPSSWLKPMNREPNMNQPIHDEITSTGLPPIKPAIESNDSECCAWRSNKTNIYQIGSQSRGPIMYGPNSNLQISRIPESSYEASNEGAMKLYKNNPTGATMSGDFLCSIPSELDFNKSQSSDHLTKNRSNEANVLSLSSYNQNCFDSSEYSPQHCTKEQPESTTYLTESPLISNDFGEDLDFIAYIAAGLQETGFDPGIVIDDPRFRRKTFTTDTPSSKANKYATYAETVSDLDTAPADAIKSNDTYYGLNYDRHDSFEHHQKEWVNFVPESTLR